jgi:hypothetical protein
LRRLLVRAAAGTNENQRLAVLVWQETEGTHGVRGIR